jgi:hypothetical protein
VIFMESDGLVMYSVYLFVLSKVITVLLVIHGPIGSQWREGERIARRVRTKARCCTCSQFEREVGSRGGGGGGAIAGDVFFVLYRLQTKETCTQSNFWWEWGAV